MFSPVAQLDAFSTPKLKKDCANMKKEWMSTCTEIEELRTRNLGIEERLESERENHRRALDQLREDRESCQEFYSCFFFNLLPRRGGSPRDVISPTVTSHCSCVFVAKIAPPPSALP